MYRHARYIAAIQFDTAAVTANEADNHVKSSCLAGAVRSKQSNNITAFYAERQAFYDFTASVALGNPSRLELTHGAPD
jgi:hypothetical protein